jgi:hypothetical protein
MFSEVKDCKVRKMVEVSRQLKFGQGEHYGIGEASVDEKGFAAQRRFLPLEFGAKQKTPI